MLRKVVSLLILITFIFSSIIIPSQARAAELLGLPEPGMMVSLSPVFEPVMMRGLRVNAQNPFLFDFIIDQGQNKVDGQALKDEGEKLIKYFLACLTVPAKDLWVNLSPYEKTRIIPKALGQTDLGRDLLSQDYILKQLTASLIYPETGLGKSFWDRVYAKAQQMYGTTEVPVNTFNKVWIMADKASVYEHGQTAFVVDSHLKVMLEEDYLAGQKNNVETQNVASLSKQIIKEIILPELEKEVNVAKNFANLRQIFNSMILASWYKNNLKQAVLNQVYTDKNKVDGIKYKEESQPLVDQIYNRYLAAYKKGVFNYIKEEVSTEPKKYFSGGVDQGQAATPTKASVRAFNQAQTTFHPLEQFNVQLAPDSSMDSQEDDRDSAMTGTREVEGNLSLFIKERTLQSQAILSAAFAVSPPTSIVTSTVGATTNMRNGFIKKISGLLTKLNQFTDQDSLAIAVFVAANSRIPREFNSGAFKFEDFSETYSKISKDSLWAQHSNKVKTLILLALVLKNHEIFIDPNVMEISMKKVKEAWNELEVWRLDVLSNALPSEVVALLTAATMKSGMDQEKIKKIFNQFVMKYGADNLEQSAILTLAWATFNHKDIPDIEIKDRNRRRIETGFFRLSRLESLGEDLNVKNVAVAWLVLASVYYKNADSRDQPADRSFTKTIKVQERVINFPTVSVRSYPNDVQARTTINETLMSLEGLLINNNYGEGIHYVLLDEKHDSLNGEGSRKIIKLIAQACGFSFWYDKSTKRYFIEIVNDSAAKEIIRAKIAEMRRIIDSGKEKEDLLQQKQKQARTKALLLAIASAIGIGVLVIGKDTIKKFFSSSSLPTSSIKSSTPQSTGGIDLDTSGQMIWDITKDGEGVQMGINSEMIKAIQRNGVQSITPIILNITPINDIWSFAGIRR